MPTPFYKLKEGNKFWRIDYLYDEDGNLNDYVGHVYEMARDSSIENYKVRFICYDRTFNKNVMFTYDVGVNDSSKYIYKGDQSDAKYLLTTSKKRYDSECKELDIKLNKNDEEGQDC